MVEPAGYMCRVVAAGEVYGKGMVASYELGTFDTISPKLALRWIKYEALRIANGLDPDPLTADWPLGIQTCATEPTLDAPTVLRKWAGHPLTQETALEQIKDGRRLFVVARDADCCYTLSICPFGNVLFAGCPAVESRCL
ncbi:hypothetical protein ACFY2H_39930 [Streptomyces griseofuscus]|uniref:hypothetical protein n=1 Tax=Streptomyces griseofuscus TaxID=146922 RepID=UPI0036B8ABB4